MADNEKSGGIGALAFIVGGLVVAVAVLVYVIYGRDSSHRPPDIKIELPASGNAPASGGAPAAGDASTSGGASASGTAPAGN